MADFSEHILRSPLFAGISEAEAKALIHCLSAQIQCFEKNEFVFRAGDKVRSIGLILSGSVHIVKEDFWGNRTIIAKFEAGGIFGEAFSYARIETLPLSVIAAEQSEIMFLDYKRIISPCEKICPFHNRLVENMLAILAKKNLMLTQKIDHITRKTTREKLLSFLSEYAIRAGSNSFTIPFNRQELADYLSVDRSAMSRELSLMRDEGIIRFDRNHFELISNLQINISYKNIQPGDFRG
ncbi:MAG TPA: Crp/Fnr family transcriptional regulator [Candidatus Atribacteria bacterium]|mgnify:CR=1 FL=1|nr:Crp/Fnr family transcriptional regulator [Candidatus Atribacteria bacterium]